MWPDLAIYGTLGKFLKPLATINLPKSPAFFRNFCKGVKTYHFSSEIILGIFLDIWRFLSGHTAPVGKVVASDTRDPQIVIQSSEHFMNIKLYYKLFWKDENKEKWGRA